MHKKRTKIVCTIGPASSSEEMLTALMKAGMNVTRLNFSHGKHEDHAEFISRIRRLAEEVGEPITVLQDLQGPKIRAGELPEEGVELKAGEQVVFTTGEASIPERLPVTYDRLHEDVKAGERILMDDGLLSAKVVSVEGQDVTCEIVDGGVLKSHKGINLPETKVSISSITEKDKEDLKFGLSQHVDWIALSFVRSAEAVRELRALIGTYKEELGLEEEYPVRIIAKIEKREAVDHIDEILEEVDGIMVARGDLGIELPAEEVPMIQKDLILKCLKAAKPVVVATQMLDSMIRNPRPTRAEVSDVANAVIDHTDAVMLSGETATGEHPLEAVETMSKVVTEAEESPYDNVPAGTIQNDISTSEGVSEVASLLASEIDAKLILVATMSGTTARAISRFRPELPIFAATVDKRVKHQLNLSWGVQPFILPRCASIDELMEKATLYLQEHGHAKAGDKIIVVAGDPVGQPGNVNLVQVKELG